MSMEETIKLMQARVCRMCAGVGKLASHVNWTMGDGKPERYSTIRPCDRCNGRGLS